LKIKKYMKKNLPSQNPFNRICRLNSLKCVLAVVLSGLTVFFAEAQVTMVKDMAPGTYSEDIYAYEFTEMTLHNGNLYFLYNYNLYKSDGTSAGTVLVKTFDFIGDLESSGSFLYFAAMEVDPTGEGDPFGVELWRTDGSDSGTVMIKDIYPGQSYSSPKNLRDVNGTLFFVANNGVNGAELWRSNGASATTMMVKDILKVSGSSNPQELVAANGKLYFTANDGMNGYELWVTNGTETGTTIVKDINPAYKASSSPTQVRNVNGTLYFLANDGVNGKQLWKSSGATGNATLVKIIRPGAYNAIGKLTKVSNLVFFQANDGVHGVELWRSDGTSSGTFMVKDLTPGPGSNTMYATDHISDFRESNGRLYFQAVAVNYLDLWTSDGTTAGTYQITSSNNPGFAWYGSWATPYNGQTYFAGLGKSDYYSLELWKTDGTVAGTMRVHENIGDGGSNNLMATELNGKLYFIGKAELWQTDGTKEGTQIVKLFGGQQSSYPMYMTDVNGQLFFEAKGGDNRTLWKSDGTEAGTVSLSETLMHATHITNINNTAYFGGFDSHGDELWKSDGTPEGTIMIKNITDNLSGTFQSTSPSNIFEYNGKAYFGAHTPFHNPHLWYSDGTPGGTQPVNPAQPPGPPAFPEQFTIAGGKLFMTGIGEKGNELYVYDGINYPVLTRDLKLHYLGSHPINLTEFNGILYFQADNRSNGYELHRSDGTLAGTYVIKDIRREDLGSGETLAPVDMGNMMATSEALYFSAIRLTGKNALWRSNGTSDGTKPYFDFAGMPNAQIIAVLGNTFLFTLTYIDSPLQLWKSNGTAIGTTKIADISELRQLVDPAVVKTINGVVYFIGHSGTQGMLWRTDGTTGGTYRIDFDGDPYDIEVSGGRLYMAGNSTDHGAELFIVNEASSATIAARSTTAPEIVNTPEEDLRFTNYPNPFTSHFSLRVNGDNDKSFRITVLNLGGAMIDDKELAYNTDHAVGQNWPDGMFILQVYTGEKMVTRKVVKQN
jgi:ELWxxDGT repeat protein